MGIDGHDWLLVLGWAANAVIGFAGVFERVVIYRHNRQIENDPGLPAYLRGEATFRRQVAVRRVWLKVTMTVVSVLELSVVWDRWWYLEYDTRDAAVCLIMMGFLFWMLTWREP